jgi:hypothetical protein
MCVFVLSVLIIYFLYGKRSTRYAVKVRGLGFGFGSPAENKKKYQVSFHQLSFDGRLAAAAERLRLCLTIRHTVYIKIKTRIFLVNRELCGAIIMTQCISSS